MPLGFSTIGSGTLGSSFQQSGSAPVFDVPGAPIIGTLVAGDGFVDVYFDPPSYDGGSPVTQYLVLLSTDQTDSGTSSPIRVSAENGIPVSAIVRAGNIEGIGPPSEESNTVIPQSEDVIPQTYQLYSTGPSLIRRTSSTGRLRLSLEFIDTPAPPERTIVLGGRSRAITAG